VAHLYTIKTLAPVSAKEKRRGESPHGSGQAYKTGSGGQHGKGASMCLPLGGGGTISSGVGEQQGCALGSGFYRTEATKNGGAHG